MLIIIMFGCYFVVVFVVFIGLVAVVEMTVGGVLILIAIVSLVIRNYSYFISLIPVLGHCVN